MLCCKCDNTIAKKCILNKKILLLIRKLHRQPLVTKLPSPYDKNKKKTQVSLRERREAGKQANSKQTIGTCHFWAVFPLRWSGGLPVFLPNTSLSPQIPFSFSWEASNEQHWHQRRLHCRLVHTWLRNERLKLILQNAVKHFLTL